MRRERDSAQQNHILKESSRVLSVDWGLRSAALVHCIVASIISVPVLFEDIGVFEYSQRAANVFSISLGYFLWDLIRSIQYTRYFGFVYIVHAVFSFSMFFLSLVTIF